VTYSIEDFLNIKTAWRSNFSPDGSKVLVQSNLTGTMQLYRVPASGGDLEQITDFDEPVTGAYLPTSDDVIIQMDVGGNERLQIYQLTNEGNDLTKLVYDPEFIHRVGGISRDGSAFAFACNKRNGVDFDIYVRTFKTAEERRVFDIGGWCQPGDFSPDGRFLSVLRLTDRNADNDSYLIDLQNGDVIHVSPHDDEAQFGMPHWLPDGSGFFFSTDTERQFSAVAKYEMAEAGWKIVVEDEWDLSCGLDWSGTNLQIAANHDGFSRIRLHDPVSFHPKAEVPLPGQGITDGIFSQDGRYFAYSYTSFVEPGDVWLYDTQARTTRRLTESPNPVRQEEFVDFDVHRFDSFDGESIPTFLARPREFEGNAPPAVVAVHGGPEGQSTAIFNPLAQYLLHRGYAVVAPNVRGSTGYGKRYHHLDDVHKRLDAVRDLEALHRWLGAAGIDTSRVALFGGSYGGYMVLAGLAFHPNLWAAGIDVVGISSLVTFLENTAAWRRKFREREYGSLENDRDFLLQASPITHVENIEAPLFIIHGRNDPRVPVTEAEQIHQVLAEKGIPSDILIYEDEGHGLQKLKNRLDAYPKALDFLDRVLKPVG